MEKLGCWLEILISSSASNSHIPGAGRACSVLRNTDSAPGRLSSTASDSNQRTSTVTQHNVTVCKHTGCWDAKGGPMLTRTRHLAWPAGVKSHTCDAWGISFLELLQETTTNLGAENNRNVFSHNSGSQKSKIKLLTGSYSFWSL